MKFYLKIIFLLAVLIFITYRIIVAFETDTNYKGIMESVKENFAGNISGGTEETGYIGVSKVTASTCKMQDYSFSMTY